MKSKLIYVLIAMIAFSLNAEASMWGATGHRVVGEIASNHLTKKTKREIKKLLNGKSLAFVSTYADEIKSDSRYGEFYTWHYINMGLDENYEESEKNSKGDLVTGIEYCKKIIQDENGSDDDRAFYLKLLVHFIGDLHQPMHVSFRDDRIGIDIKVKGPCKKNLHTAWDICLIERGLGIDTSNIIRNLHATINDQSRKRSADGKVEKMIRSESWVADLAKFGNCLDSLLRSKKNSDFSNFGTAPAFKGLNL